MYAEPVLLEVNGLSKHFGGLKAIDKVSFSVNMTEIIGIIGPNGAGKTTLFNLITGMINPTGGNVVFQGESITRYSAHEIVGKGIVHTHQIPQPFYNLTVYENVYLSYIKRSNKNSPKTEVTRILTQVGLAQKADKYPDNLTLGDRKKLEIARSLATQPVLLLLDEVAGGLNPVECDEILSLVKEVRDMGITVILIEHIMKVVMNLSDRIIVLNFGEKIAEGYPGEIIQNPAVIEAYLGKKRLEVM